MNSGRSRPGTAQTLAKLNGGVVVNKTLTAFPEVTKQDFKTVLEKYIAYREKKPVKLSLFGGYTRAEKVNVSGKLLQLDKNPIELTLHDYRVMTQGRLGLFIRYCKESHLLHIERIKRGDEIKYHVSCRI